MKPTSQRFLAHLASHPDGAPDDPEGIARTLDIPEAAVQGSLHALRLHGYIAREGGTVRITDRGRARLEGGPRQGQGQGPAALMVAVPVSPAHLRRLRAEASRRGMPLWTAVRMAWAAGRLGPYAPEARVLDVVVTLDQAGLDALLEEAP